jgi:hypothetical protein
MYVYVAVDVHTLDLLHIHIFPHLGKNAARTFLLELRAKGYAPRAIITDLNADYAEPLAEVFPQAVHHECVFTPCSLGIAVSKTLSGVTIVFLRRNYHDREDVGG